MTRSLNPTQSISRTSKIWTNIRAFSFEYWWLAILALLVRRVPFAVTSPSDFVALKKTVLVVSYLILILVLVKNWRYFSVRVILIGVVMNLAAISANGGLMPVTPGTRDLAGMLYLGPEWIGQVLPQGSGILLPLENTNLWILTDIIPIRAVHAIFSIGDMIMFCGLILFIVEALFRTFPTKESERAGKASLSTGSPESTQG